ncbi:thermonuclease family protein [Paracidovorax citrulli]
MRNTSIRYILAALTTLLLATPACARLTGKVVRIIDGDTIDVLVEQRPVRIRLAGIDAPERGQPFGERARQHLASLVFRQDVVVDDTDVDRYGRTLGHVYLGADGATQTNLDRSVNAALVARGMAWAYRVRGRATEPSYERHEQEARQKPVGLWTEPGAVDPSQWRRMQQRQ